MQDALADAGAPRPVDVVIDLGAPGGRTGCRDLDTAEAVARAVRAADRLRLVGAGGFEGALAPDRSPTSLTTIRGYLRSVRDLIMRLDTAGLFDETDEIIVTAGGSAYFDEVVERARRRVERVAAGADGVAQRRVHHPRRRPLPADDADRRVTPGAFRPALRIHGRVLSLPEPGLALLDFGKRDAPIDLGLPEPQTVRRADGTVGAADRLRDHGARRPARVPVLRPRDPRWRSATSSAAASRTRARRSTSGS